jgi:hypothetical protein
MKMNNSDCTLKTIIFLPGTGSSSLVRLSVKTGTVRLIRRVVESAGPDFAAFAHHRSALAWYGRCFLVRVKPVSCFQKLSELWLLQMYPLEILYLKQKNNKVYETKNEVMLNQESILPNLGFLHFPIFPVKLECLKHKKITPLL